MFYHIKTYGCQMNYADSERIRTVFEAYGLIQTEKVEEASYIVLNSCAVREKAEDKLFGKGKEVHREKVKNKKLGNDYPISIMTGCIVKTGINGKVKRESVLSIQKRILEKAQWLDYAVPTKEVFKLIEGLLKRDKNVTEIRKLRDIEESNTGTNYLEIQPTTYSNYQASLPISVGCNHHCSYCTVPFSRGVESFRSYENIKSEFDDYVQKGFKQITLLGQTVNKWLNPNLKYHPKAYSWYKMGELLPNANDSNGEPDNFLELIKELDKVEGDYWLNFVSSYPNYFADDCIDYICNSILSEKGHITPTIHLAVQSGSNSMLEKMNRHYTIEEFLHIVKKFREIIPEISVTTDIIVGYPTETEAEFQDTLELCENFQFDMIYISEYSKRSNTPDENIEDDISPELKKKRKNLLNDILTDSLIEKNKVFVDSVQNVLVSDHHKNSLIGKNKYGKDVMISVGKNDKSDYIGQFVQVKIVNSSPWGLEGLIV